MADIDWGLLSSANAPLANPVDVLRASTADRDAQAQTAIKQQQENQAIALAARQQAAQQQAGTLYGSGDTRGATAAMIGGGVDPSLITATTGADTQSDKEHQDGLQAIGGFANYVQQHISDPAARAAVIQHNAPLLVAAGAHPDDIAAIVADPSDANLGAVAHQFYTPKDQDAAAVAQQTADNGTITANNGTITANATAKNADTDRYKAVVDAGKPTFGSEGQTPFFNNVPAPGATAAPIGPVDAKTLYNTAIKPLETGGQPYGGAGAVGAPTAYGTAIGASQMLPATAQAMASKIGVPWRPDLMIAHTPQGLAYQDQLGTAYAQTALDASGGDAAKALAYYYGGPNQALHGPKTAAYVQAGLVKLGAGSPAVVNATAGVQLTPKAAGGANGVANLDPATIDNAAWQVIATNQMPSLGMGSAGARAAILNRKAQLQQQYGITNDQIVRNAASYHADNTTLATLQKQYDLITGNEGAVKQNFVQWLNASKQLPDPNGLGVTQSLVNPVARLFGNTHVLPADGARRTAVDEYARVMTAGASSAGHTTDSATKNYDAVFPQAASYDQKVQIVNQATRDMENRKNALEQQIAATQQRIAARANPTSYASAHQQAPAIGQAPTQTAANSSVPAGATLVGASKKTGRPVYRLPNGAMVLG